MTLRFWPQVQSRKTFGLSIAKLFAFNSDACVIVSDSACSTLFICNWFFQCISLHVLTMQLLESLQLGSKDWPSNAGLHESLGMKAASKTCLNALHLTTKLQCSVGLSTNVPIFWEGFKWHKSKGATQSIMDSMLLSPGHPHGFQFMGIGKISSCLMTVWQIPIFTAQQCLQSKPVCFFGTVDIKEPSYVLSESVKAWWQWWPQLWSVEFKIDFNLCVVRHTCLNTSCSNAHAHCSPTCLRHRDHRFFCTFLKSKPLWLCWFENSCQNRTSSGSSLDSWLQ